MRPIDSILTVADQYDTIVFDQWGVLHNGKVPYSDAIATVSALRDRGKQMAVLSNSGKSSHVNRKRITAMGFPDRAFDVVMTSGEALHIDMLEGRLVDIKTLHAITARPDDAVVWAEGLKVTLTDDIAKADAVLLMGLPDAQDHPDEEALLTEARKHGIPVICSNPDRASPRADGVTVQSPGALAHAHADAGGQVTFYGKPHKAIFEVLSKALHIEDPTKVLMVGDSPEHDIAGAQTVGWHSLFIAGGLHVADTGNLFKGMQSPTYSLPILR